MTMMREVLEVQTEACAMIRHDATKLFDIRGLAVSGQAHDPVFVAKIPKPKILRERCVKQSQRMGEDDTPLNAHAAASARAPHCSGKIAEAVRREESRTIEGRHKKGAGQMRAMMLHAMESRANPPAIRFESFGKRFRNGSKRGPRFGALSRKTRHANGVKQLGTHTRPRTARQSDVIDISQSDTGSFETIANRSNGKSRGIFDAIEALLFDRGHELAIADQCRGGIRVISIDAENVHTKLRPAAQLAAASAAESSEARDSASSTCRRTHSLSTNRLQGRAQPVRLLKNLCHTDCTASGSISKASEGVSDSSLRPNSKPSSPRNQLSQGSINARLGLNSISGGRRSFTASASNAFGVRALHFAASGNAATISTNSSSSMGTRTSREWRMLIESVSRRSVFSMYVRSSR